LPMLTVVVCPGIHAPKLTDSFVKALQLEESVFQQQPLILSPQKIPIYSPQHILKSLNLHCSSEAPLLFICFSAGVVGGLGAARLWQRQGGNVKALIALDGWGVWLDASFPIHRLSHDGWTHESSGWFAPQYTSFYADPAVEHQELWRSPHSTYGWQVTTNQKTRTTAVDFIHSLLQQYSKTAASNPEGN
jgi:hypothetical protein